MLIVLWAATPVEKVITVVDLRGVPAREAFEKLGEALEERIIIAREVPVEVLEQDVRLHTEHLSPEQSVRWVARLVGLEAVRTKEGYYVATGAHLQKLGTPLQGTDRHLVANAPASEPAEGGGATPATEDPVQEFNQHGSIFWQDTPLTRVAADISRVFGVDVIVHPDVAGSETLLDWEQPDTSLQRTCNYLADRLKATLELRDGALWIRPADLREGSETLASAPSRVESPAIVDAHRDKCAAPLASSQTQPASQVEATVPRESSQQVAQESAEPEVRPAMAAMQKPHALALPPKVIYRADGSGSSNLEPLEPRRSIHETPPTRAGRERPRLPGRLAVDSSIRDWSTFARHLEMATGGPCRVHESGRRFERMEIDGEVTQVLEALKLMGKLDYRVEARSPAAAPALELDISPAR